MNNLQDSELILNPNGSIYHLNLLPNQIAKNVIVVGDPERVAIIAKHFETVLAYEQKREFVTKTGTYKGKEITVMSTGIGCDNIDIVINELDALVNFDLKERKLKEKHTALNIVRIGTCGSLQADLEVDSFVASTHGLGMDGLLHYYDYQNTPEETEILEAFLKHSNWKEIPAKPYLIDCSNELLESIAFDMHKGITATAGGFYGPQGRYLRAPLKKNDLNEVLRDFNYKDNRIVNFEMETSALYGLGRRILGHHCLTVCAVIANRERKNFSNDPYKALDSLILKVLDRI